MTNSTSAEALAAFNFILENADLQDEGPLGYGWQSQKMTEAIATVRATLEAEPKAQAPAEWEVAKDCLTAIKAQCEVQPSALAKAIVVTCERGLLALSTASEPKAQDEPVAQSKGAHDHMMTVAWRVVQSGGYNSTKELVRSICKAIAADKNLRAKLATPVSYDAALQAERERLCAAIKEADDKAGVEADYMLDSNDCISVIRGTWNPDAARTEGKT